MQVLIVTSEKEYVCDNMASANNNFERLFSLNTNLSQQIVQLNAHITELQNKIKLTNENITQNTTHIEEVKINIGHLHENITDLNQTLALNMSRLEQSEKKIIELVKKVGTLLSYMPQFVQDTTSYFVKLITCIKMKNTNDLPMITYDTHLLDV